MTDDETAIIRESAERLFADHCGRAVVEQASEGVWPDKLWAELEDAGFTFALVSEQGGGAGLELASALVLIEVAAAFAVPVPLAETMIAAWLLDRAGLAVPAGPLTFAAVEGSCERVQDGWHLTGTAHRVPWGGSAGLVAVATQAEGAQLFLLEEGICTVAAGANVAGEPRDTLRIDTVVGAASSRPSPISVEDLDAIGAAVRSLQIAGALRRATDLSLQYAQLRSQFGRPLAKFQAIQQNLAVLATQAALAAMSAAMARHAVASGKLMPGAAMAKARAGEAASAGAAIAHQVHGAIGFTREHELQFYTRRLYAWRDEFGNEAKWNRLYGSHLAAAGADALWPLITDSSWEAANVQI